MSIKFDNVSYIYSPKTPFEYLALKDINLEIKKGSFTCIVGKTGCGKSTLIQELNGLLIPITGKVNIDNFVVSSNKKERTKKMQPLKKHVGVVFQFSENQLFEETVEDDVVFGPLNFGYKKEEAKELAHKALKDVGLDESYFEKSPFELSGGEKRRVSIAGILAFNPEIIVLDEPTAGLDPNGAKEILSLFKKLQLEGKTVILVTHDMNIVFEYASDVIVMNDGKVVKVTSPSELFLEDVEQYSLETPMLVKIVRKLIQKGYEINLNNVHDMNSLINELKGAKHV